MAGNSILSSISEIFPKSDKEIWRQAASQEMEGRDPLEILSWQSRDGLIFFPYYDHRDGTAFRSPEKNQRAVTDNSFSVPRKWINAAGVSVPGTDNIKANEKALSHLTHGADGIFFKVHGSASAIDRLLHQIEWPYCSLFFRAENNHSLSRELLAYIATMNWRLETLAGGLFWDKVPKRSEVDLRFLELKNFRSLGLVIPPSSPTREILSALVEGVRTVEELKNDADIDSIFRAVSFSIPADILFFESIAKLRSLRWLWYQVSQIYQVKNYQPADLHLHVRSESWITENFQPHGNMLKSTTAAIASVLGGCDSLTIDGEDDSNLVMNRIARNISSILREESYLDKVSDPLAGSYALDVMSVELAKKAWSLFQSEMKK
jgi:methylmalonyl-CoA mutase